MAEYASKGVAGAGLGLGIAGTAIGLLNNGGLGGLGGILGGNGTAVGLGVLAEKDAKIASLTAEKYADHVGVEVYAQSRRENTDLGDRILGNWIKPLAQESAANRERIAVLETKVQCGIEKAELREQIMNQKIDSVAREAAHGIADLGMGVAALKQTVDGITRTIIPKDAICPPVMPRWNSWEAPTNSAPDTQPVTVNN